MADLRVGLIGLGAMGRHHARLVRETPGLELVAVADPGGDRFGVAGGLPVLESVEQLVAVGLDVAVVAVPTSLHEDVAVPLAEAGVPTLIEKPIAGTVESAERVLAAFERADCIGAVGYVERCNPALVEMRRRMGEGELGEIYQIATSRQGPFPARISDVGVVKDLATHDIDLTSWLAGSPYASVSAQIAHISGRPHEDMVVASGRLANGIIVNHVINWLSPRKERQTVVTGERGAFVADTGSGDLTFYANGTVINEWEQLASFRGVSEGDMRRYAFAKREPLRMEHEHFRDAVLTGDTSSIVTLAEGLETLRVVEAVLRSADAGAAVTL
ncbi:MAG TPA: Gfo/Idh/MocA family oxidoreductase [Propionibacteriaceae bacterium]|nr:Gfo/Idh/MocA family oxidoreductase [Propionibacteriaceae bacterium]